MSKYYIKCGSLELIYSTDKNQLDAAVSALWETNENDILDEYFYIDERGYRGLETADEYTAIIPSQAVLDSAGWES